MKICPKCRREFEEKFKFCLEDGTALVDASLLTNPEDEQVTIIGRQKNTESAEDEIAPGVDSRHKEIPQSAVETEVWDSDSPLMDEEDSQGPLIEEDVPAGDAEPGGRKSYLGVLVLVIAIFGLLGLATAVGGAYLYYRSQFQNDTAAANSNEDANTNSNEDVFDDDSNENTGLEEGDSNENTQSNPETKKDEKPTPAVTPSPSPVVDGATPVPFEIPKPSTPTPVPTLVITPRPTQKPTPVPTPTRVAVPSRIAGGVVNGKALSLPKPAYPPAARAVGARGTVRVAVVIGRDGRVLSASAVSGHPLLRGAATTAARKSTFRPTLIQGQPVEVSGVIVYNFRP